MTDTIRSKLIVLFSDGTGNSSGKLFKTNVWRLYEALDLGPTGSSDMRSQVAYYDNGVGTSGFKPFAVLGGVFGFGLKRNVLAIYRYACRNYTVGSDDRIQAFGFSRGAFTIRLVIALIASQGLVDYEDERDLLRKSDAIYRAFRRESEPRFFLAAWIFRGLRALRDALGALHTLIFVGTAPAPDLRYHPVIEYVGVWDTVAAYGGPVAEITRAIDNWIFPLSMPNYHLARQVRAARHALAIDDERDSFHPLLWDEVHEAQMVAADAAKPEGDPDKIVAGRLQQLWFAGMHSDVGGGYPDESLSYVSLCWIMDGAQAAGIRFLPDLEKRIREIANAYGPLHNSRQGLGAYYRYQPRRIAAWLHPVDPATYILRDPAIVDAAGNQQGLLLDCKVHESVVARIVAGTDDYAPITLPAQFGIVPPNTPQANQIPVVSDAVRKRLADAKLMAARAQRQSTLYDKVWWRRVLYFASVLVTLQLFAMPFSSWVASNTPWLAGFEAFGPFRFLGAAIAWVGAMAPDFAQRWIAAWSQSPLYTLILIGILGFLMMKSNSVELNLRDGTRRLWWATVDASEPALPGPDTSALRRIRESKPYQRGLQWFKWKLLPNILGPLMIASALWCATVVIVQLRIAVQEGNRSVCPASAAAVPLAAPRHVDFLTRNPCNRTGVSLTAGHRYAVTFYVEEPWYDGPLRATPAGLLDHHPWYIDLLGNGWQRAVEASWFQPLAAVRPARKPGELLQSMQVVKLDMNKAAAADGWRGEFEAPDNGELFLLVNDAVKPWGPANFYYTDGRRANRGTACAVVEDLNPSEDTATTTREETKKGASQPAGPVTGAKATTICGRLDQRIREAMPMR